MRVGLALGAGGVKGFAHIGVLRALERLKIKIDVISGTSIGSIIGGAYCLNPDADHIERLIFDVFDKYSKDIVGLKVFSTSTSIEEKMLFLEKSFGFVKDFLLWNLRIIKPHIVDPRPFANITKDIFSDYTFSDCKIPFVATSIELARGDKVFLREGSLNNAVTASFAIPGVFPPLKHEGGYLADGGVLMPIPVEAIKKDADFVIGVNAEGNDEPLPQINNAINMMFASDRLRYRQIVRDNAKLADFIITPDLGSIHWADFDRAKEIVEYGYKITLAEGGKLKKALGLSRLKSIFKIPHIFKGS